MATTVYLDYSQEALDHNFDQRSWAPNAVEIMQRCTERSRQTRACLRNLSGVPYGASADEVLDIFPAPSSAGQVLIFVHGGAWRLSTKDDYSYVAEGFVPAGIHTVIVNFSNLPEVRLPEMVDKVRRAIEWVHCNAAAFGGDPGKLYLLGQSSGAHLAAAALLDCRPIVAAALLSGPYFLEPVVLSARGSYVKLEAPEVAALSPGLRASRVPCPVLLAYASRDTDEFRRQTQAFAVALEGAGRLASLMRFEGLNHFELMECLGDPRHRLVGAVLEQMRIGHSAEQ